MKTNVYIDSACDIHYSSFYIDGLIKIFGKKAVKFSSNYFGEFKHNNHFLAIVVKQNNVPYKICIDFTDEDLIDQKAYNWCDLYAKININLDESANLEKLISIGPSFGIRIFSKTKTYLIAFSNLVKSYNRIPNKKKFLSDYNAQLKRLQLKDYKNSEEKRINNYIYFVSSLWKKEKITNQFRANFIDAASSNANVVFEGGFAPRSKNDMPEFSNLIIDKKEKFLNYLQKTKNSMLVFNTPAVLNCHGWKLAEFLALGKTIISTPLSRKLPENLIDNVHFLLTNGSKADINTKIQLIVDNVNLKQKLEKNSLDYFTTFLAPEKVILQLCKTLAINTSPKI